MAFIPAWSRAALDISTVLRLARAKGNIRSCANRPVSITGAAATSRPRWRNLGAVGSGSDPRRRR